MLTRKLFSALLLGLLPIVVSGQQLGMITTYGPEDEKGRRDAIKEEHFNDKGVLTYVERYTDYDGHESNYDEFGRLTGEEFWCDTTPYYFETFFEYNDTAVLFYDQQTNDYRVYHVDSMGKLIKTQFGYWVGEPNYYEDFYGFVEGDSDLTDLNTHSDFKYDEQGKLIAVLTKKGRHPDYVQQEFHNRTPDGRLTTSIYEAPFNGDQDSVSYGYDPSGRLNEMSLITISHSPGKLRNRKSTFEIQYRDAVSRKKSRHRKRNLAFINEIFSFAALDSFYPAIRTDFPFQNIAEIPLIITDDVNWISYSNSLSGGRFTIDFKYDKKGRLTQINASDSTHSNVKSLWLMEIVYDGKWPEYVYRNGFLYGDVILSRWNQVIPARLQTVIDIYEKDLRVKTNIENLPGEVFQSYTYRYDYY